jgi:hypothetical protein
MSLVNFIRSLELRWIYKVDGWTQPRIAVKVFRFLEMRMAIDGNSPGESVSWESGGRVVGRFNCLIKTTQSPNTLIFNLEYVLLFQSYHARYMQTQFLFDIDYLLVCKIKAETHSFFEN